ncbi:MAG TPA: hypothetical protein VKY89_08220 [Thermoanaerobaculia bacterium]|nr:hypothetical protein [Thermoanaerobaculia bacterium]
MPDRSRRSARAPFAAGAAVAFAAATVVAVATAVSLAATGGPPAAPPAAAPVDRGRIEVSADMKQLNGIAESYVKLVLAVGQHDANYVDAFYGPAEWKQAAETAGKRPLAELRAEARSLLAALGDVAAPPAAAPPAPAPPAAIPPAATAGVAAPDGGDSPDELLRLRRRFLERQLSSLAAHVDALSGARMSFDEESRALYDAVAPTWDAAHFQAILDRIDHLVPGTGPLAARITAYRQRFVIPPDRVAAVFAAAIAECRRRTAAHIALPPGESFEVAYVKDKPWSGYNWYQGGFHSLIQVNTDLPIYIDRALDLAGHEGYPGHHVYNSLLEQHLVRQRGWIELTVYPLFSPQSLIAEGTANFGVEVVFPGPERVVFERQVLYPAAGLDPAAAANYDQVQELLRESSYAGNEAARGYLDGRLSREAAQAWLERYGLMSPERAAQRLRFIDTYRSYVINYNYGQDLVRRYIDSRGGTAEQPERRWREFARLISSPRLPSDLR